MRGVAQRVVVRRPQAHADLVDLLPDGDHGVTEAIQLGEVLALGGLDHERAGDRERHGRRVQAVVGEPLGDVIHGDAGGLGHRAQVEDALVGDEPIGSGVEEREMRVQPARDVVGGGDRGQGGQAQAIGTHHPHKRPRDRQNRWAAPGSG